MSVTACTWRLLHMNVFYLSQVVGWRWCLIRFRMKIYYAAFLLWFLCCSGRELVGHDERSEWETRRGNLNLKICGDNAAICHYCTCGANISGTGRDSRVYNTVTALYYNNYWKQLVTKWQHKRIELEERERREERKRKLKLTNKLTEFLKKKRKRKKKQIRV